MKMPMLSKGPTPEQISQPWFGYLLAAVIVLIIVAFWYGAILLLSWLIS